MLALTLFPAALTAGLGERVFNENPAQSGQAFPIFAGERAAQSFVPTERFLLVNVTLDVKNLSPQTDALNVTVQTDVAGSPSGTVIAWAEQISTGGGWRDFAMVPSVILAVGTTYWIVAANGAATGGEGYEWTHANADVVPGVAKRDVGAGWNSTATDMSYAVWGLPTEPEVSLGVSVDRSVVDPGQSLNYTVYLNNTGFGIPRGAWVNLTFPAGLNYVSDTSASIGGIKTGAASWTFSSLGNGAHAFGVTARSGSPPTTFLNTTVHFDYADSAGASRPTQSAMVSVRSTVVIVTPPPPGLLDNPAALALLAGAAIAPAAYWGWRRRRPAIEEVFVVHRSGILLYHLSRSLKGHEDPDKDVLGAMFTVVQEFVKDSFRYSANRDLNKMEFGQYKILIERGKHVYVAVASLGDVGDLAGKVRHVVDEMEEKHGDALAHFSGRMESLVGIRDIVQQLAGRT